MKKSIKNLESKSIKNLNAVKGGAFIRKYKLRKK